MGIEKGSILCREAFFKYCIEGAGIPTLVIGSALYYPKSFSRALRRYLRMAFVDWRGFAEPISKEEDINGLDAYIDDIERLRQELHLKKVVVIGHSAHALLALEYAKKYPDHVSAVVMIGISPNLSSKYAEWAAKSWAETASSERKAALNSRLQDDFSGLSRSQQFIKWYVSRDPQAWYDYNFNSAPLWDGIKLQMDHFDDLYGVILRDLDVANGLKDLHKPVFLAMGKYDYIVAPMTAWEPLKPQFHNLTPRLFEKSGHSPQFEESGLFDQELLQWLSHQQMSLE